MTMRPSQNDRAGQAIRFEPAAYLEMATGLKQRRHSERPMNTDTNLTIETRPMVRYPQLESYQLANLLAVDSPLPRDRGGASRGRSIPAKRAGRCCPARESGT